MSALKPIPEGYTLTQDAQQIEPGADLKAFEDALSITEDIQQKAEQKIVAATGSLHADKAPIPNYPLLRLINMSSLPMSLFPPLNILLPLALMVVMNQRVTLAKQIISLQIMWTVAGIVLTTLQIFIRPTDKGMAVVTVVGLILTNAYIILKNAKAINKRKALYYKLKFRFI